MKFLESVKRAFGFDREEYIEEDLDDETTDERISTTPYINPFKNEKHTNNSNVAKPLVASNPSPVTEENQPIVATEAVPDSILQRIVEILNANLPDYVVKCLDTTAQKRYIADTIKGAFSDYTAQMKQQAYASEKEEWKSKVKEAELKVEALTAELNEAKTQADDVKAKYTVNEAQRRSLNEKIQALEAKVSNAEAEVEQYELENKSLLNKLKVVQVKTDDVDYFKTENSKLLAEINKLKADAVKNDSIYKETEVVKAQLDDIQNANIKLQEELTATTTAKDSEIADLKKEIDIAKAIADSLRVNAAEAQAQLKDAKAQLEEAQTQSTPALETQNSTEVEDLKEKLRLSCEQIESLQEELNEANSNLEVVEKIQEQLDKVDEMKRVKNEKIDMLNSTLRTRDKEIEDLNSAINTLKQSIASDKSRYSLELKELASTYEAKIAALTQSPKPQPAEKDIFDLTEVEDKVPAAPIKKEPEVKHNTSALEMNFVQDEEKNYAPASDDKNEDPLISAVDHEMDDWLLPSPPTPLIQDIEPKTEESEQAQKDVKEDNTLQMSLF